MDAKPRYVDGELFLTVETVAELYRTEAVVLRRVYTHGLLEAGLEEGGELLIAAIQLDRVATIVRLHVLLGLDLDTVELALSGQRG